MFQILLYLIAENTDNVNILAIIGFINIVDMIVFILYVVAMWKVFVKAGQKGWYSLIPIFNLIRYWKIIGCYNAWSLLLLVPGLNLIFIVMMWINFAKSFNKTSPKWIIMSVIFPMITTIIIGFGDAEYIGPGGVKKDQSNSAPQPSQPAPVAAQSTPATQPVPTVQPVQPIQPAPTTQPVQPTPVVAQPAQVAQPTQPVQPASSPQPVQPASSPQPAQVAQPIQSTPVATQPAPVVQPVPTAQPNPVIQPAQPTPVSQSSLNNSNQSVPSTNPEQPKM